jgi:modification methylase
MLAWSEIAPRVAMAASAHPALTPLSDLPTNVWFVGQESLPAQRQDRYLTTAVRGHSGKMRPALARQLIDAFSHPGDWVLDPMAGIGTTGVEAVHRGRHYVGIEVEERFVAWQRQHLKRARAHGASGRFAVFKADARRLNHHFRGVPWRNAADADVPAPAPAVDTVIVSPPYGNRLSDRPRAGRSPYVQHLLAQRPHTPTLVPTPYGAGASNVGNLTGHAYWTAMHHVYAGCYQVLRPGGLLVIVLQPNRDDAQLQPLHHDTARLCQGLGFAFVDEIVAVLGRVIAAPDEPVRLVSSTSFWRRLLTVRLREAGWPVTLCQLEYVLVFRKPEREPGAAGTAKAASRPPLPAPVLAHQAECRRG